MALFLNGLRRRISFRTLWANKMSQGGVLLFDCDITGAAFIDGTALIEGFSLVDGNLDGALLVD